MQQFKPGSECTVSSVAKIVKFSDVVQQIPIDRNEGPTA
jgi:hypothetical protein